MNLMHYRLVLCILILLPNLVHSEKIRMITTDWPPFYGENLYKNGVSHEIVKQALKRKGHSLTTEFVPWARAMSMAKQGHYHGLFGAWVNDEIRSDYYFSRESFGIGDGHFLDLESNISKYLKPEDLKGKTIGYVLDYPVSKTLSQLFQTGAIIKYEVTSVSQLIQMHQAKRIDYILENYEVFKHYFMREKPNEEFNYKIIGKDYIDGGLYIGWTKRKPNMRLLRDELDEALREMKADGSIQAILTEFEMH